MRVTVSGAQGSLSRSPGLRLVHASRLPQRDAAKLSPDLFAENDQKSTASNVSTCARARTFCRAG